MSLQDVVGEGVTERDCAHFFDAAHGQLPQVPVAPTGMDAFADRTTFVARLARLARHSGTPSQDTWAVAAPWPIGIGAVLGFGGRTIDVEPFGMRPLDVLRAGKAAID